MSNEAFTFFWLGCGAGLVLGIVLAAIMAAAANAIERDGHENG